MLRSLSFHSHLGKEVHSSHLLLTSLTNRLQLTRIKTWSYRKKHAPTQIDKKRRAPTGPLNLPAMLVDRRRRSSASIVDVSSVVDVSSIAGNFPAMLETSIAIAIAINVSSVVDVSSIAGNVDDLIKDLMYI